ncbi:DegV family protein [Staphylococcus gallinarum]|jgi:DegV family protein with EDD domain|uniref:DegV family protein n=2 Tax=Staphylococcus gallinarum TaxID=1293 RepID=A0ABQ0Y169_STAGA|nr:DegV family protein [Staphylococcus gallinarum]KIR11879.1 DegV domain-containing protein [Staphylococcus gallinarum]MBU7216229.1 DegV family protein [Staphylococcus gallinarum]MCD8792948.1 DegV family protein [Staphylococcus gallinarum]MCD8820185.1 DegV family protein [Staphylococcus gallinarum]MCD8828219.1 DegV family protein [Staphylococcus gallinarum]
MSKKKIVTDSTSDLSQKYLTDNDINVIPLNLTIDGESFADQIDISSEAFIEKIENDADVKTSQPAIGKFIDLYDELGADGSEIISIHMTSGLSGTYQTALQASQMTKSNVTVIDSKSISYGLGYQVQHVVKWNNEGLSTTDIVNQINELQKDIKLYVVIGQLNQLIKGGRISKTKGLIGNMMKIKPIGTLVDGKIELIHNSRTQNASIQYLKKEITQFIGDKKIKSIGIAHANIIEFVDKIKKHFTEEFNFTQYDTNVTTPVISTHTGQGAIGLVVLRS